MASLAQLERAWNSILDKYEAVLRLRLLAHFNKMINELKVQLEESGPIGGAFLLMNADRELEEIFNDVLPQVAKAGAGFTLEDLQPKSEENESVAGEVLLTLGLWLLANSKERAKLINRTTIKLFTQITFDFQNQGLSGEDLSKSILQKLKQRNKSRANVISATETHNVASKGQIHAGVIVNQRVDKTWVSQRDTRVRSSHILADGQRVPIEQPFRVGTSLMMRPSDPAGGPAETIGCRCFIRLKRLN